MTHLYDIVDSDELGAAIAAKHVREQFHPTEPLAILNYTEACVYDRAWTTTTLACRGLIYRTDTGEVIARPFAKFFNYGQTEAPSLDLAEPAVVTDKADGSLGILYPLPSGGWAIATRGSFTSDQAAHATTVLAEEYADFKPEPGTTVLFEIVYPDNRIVLDYGQLDDLLLLGAVDIATGRVHDIDEVEDWPGSSVTTFPAATLADALAMEPRPNAEGVVVRMRRSGAMVKLKQDDYVALHRIVTGLTARVVWQHLIDGKPLNDLITPLPDEFHEWVRDTANQIARAVLHRWDELWTEFNRLCGALDDQTDRREFARLAVPHPDKWAMFLLLDGREDKLRAELWKRAKPAPFQTPTGRVYTEDTA